MQTRSFCYVDDLVEGLIRLMETDDGVVGPVNLGNPEEFTIRQLAEIVVDITGSASKIVHRPLPTDDPKQRQPAISKAQELLGWRPTVPLRAGLGAIEQMLGEDAQQLAGTPHNRGGGRVGHRWGRTKGKIGFHGGKVAVHRPRVRSYDGHELALATWTAAQAEDWLGRWAMNLMLINVSTRKLRRAVRLPEGDMPVIAGDGTSKSAASRRFVALSAERLAEWMASDLSKLDLLVIQIDGLHIGNDLVLVAALGVDGEGRKHPLALIDGATENAAVGQALIDNLIERGLDPKVCRLFVIDDAD